MQGENFEYLRQDNPGDDGSDEDEAQLLEYRFDNRLEILDWHSKEIAGWRFDG